MKRIASISLLTILLFNFFGYRLVTSFLEDQANARLESKLDKQQYDDNQLISIKVPVSHLSYYNTSPQFERVDGQVEINGAAYHYVKRRIYNDSVEMLCIPNPAVTSIQSAKDQFFQLVNDLQRTGQSKKSDQHSSKNFSTDNYTLLESLQLSRNSFIRKNNISVFNSPVSKRSIPVSGRPPEIC